jgi:hypothetical protein
MRRLLLLFLMGGCSGRSQIELDYSLMGIQPGDVLRLETTVAVDPSDPRNFFADTPFRTVANGVGYEVRDFDGSGQRRMIITHDVSLGFTFSPAFVFTLLPPANEGPPPLVIIARAQGMSDRIGSSAQLHVAFGDGRKLAVPVMDLRCGGGVCGADQTCCNDACIDTSADHNNCGGCGHACGAGADSCALDICRCGSGSPCADGESCCSGLGCVDLSSSAFNCGTCGHACNPGEVCSGGTCMCGKNAACADGGLCCAGGVCSTTGSCPCGSMDCPAPNLCCDPVAGSCVDVRGDNANCGACGVSCPAPLQCQNGACTCIGQICGMGDSCCDSGCANLMNDGANCGTCGHACAANEMCVNGACTCGNTQCTAGQACCAGACVDSDSDSMNCGGCGHLCNAGETCMGGACLCPGTTPARACTEPPEGCCGAGPTDSGGCFDLTSSHDHCGNCGIACGANEECQGSRCVAVTCSPTCTNNNHCNMGVCQCNGADPCTGAQTCCASGCTDTTTDPTNCGACGTKCTDTQLCCGSTCVPRDAAHCQACNQGCASSGGSTLPSLCCDGNGNWQCTPESTQNCGTCGHLCMMGQVCCNAGAGPGSGTGGCVQESDFACGPNCTNCNAAGGVCCNHQCCGTTCCSGKCCAAIITCGLALCL